MVMPDHDFPFFQRTTRAAAAADMSEVTCEICYMQLPQAVRNSDFQFMQNKSLGVHSKNAVHSVLCGI